MVRKGPARVHLRLCIMQLFLYVWRFFTIKKYLFVYGYTPPSLNYSLKILFPTIMFLEKWLIPDLGREMPS